MKPKTQSKSSDRSRRIGRKVLHADRLAKALGTTRPKQAKSFRRYLTLKPKVTVLATIAVIFLGSLSFGGLQFYATQNTKAQKAQIAEQLKKEKVDSEKADACRRQKAQEKADQIGKVTFDELYDYGECDT